MRVLAEGYIGSCNFGWDSLTLVKELGVLLENAADIVGDLQRVFEQYWALGDMTKLPNVWPDKCVTRCCLFVSRHLRYCGVFCF